MIFHVLYKRSEQNISDEKILAVLETLQNDFLGINADISNVPDEFKPRIGMPNIKFFLAQEVPGIEGKNGIIRKYTQVSKFNLKKNKMFAESPIINPDRYLNVYICNVNTNGYYPNSNDPDLDGIVIGYWRAEKGIRTLTHEAGHWFDLYHIFEGGCDNKDKVDDTRAQKKHMHTCPVYPKIECRNSVMFMNFMDYSCSRNFFTIGQVERMRLYISKYKPQLQRE